MTGKTSARRTDLDGHVAIVTGGSSGLGHAIALALAEAGSAVALVSRRREAGERAAARITSCTGRAASALACDVSDEAGVHRVVGEVAERFGRLDILVTSAGDPGQGRRRRARRGPAPALP
ncbi:SDR family NAD(P)-dependent oxidoreductase [Nonomuraea sp. NPDC005692]|uniref:SDR family NAD(P)-dependent oxidoreductase n=1 Tax=Nonomuraea sp. NPDC005692 TaxID=3157168 RepID=UPI0033E2EF34